MFNITGPVMSVLGSMAGIEKMKSMKSLAPTPESGDTEAIHAAGQVDTIMGEVEAAENPEEYINSLTDYTPLERDLISHAHQQGKEQVAAQEALNKIGKVLTQKNNRREMKKKIKNIIGGNK